MHKEESLLPCLQFSPFLKLHWPCLHFNDHLSRVKLQRLLKDIKDIFEWPDRVIYNSLQPFKNF